MTETTTFLTSVALVGFCLFYPSIAAAQGTYQSNAYDYSIAVPDGWEKVPRDVVEQQFPAATREDTPYVYDVVFDKADGPRFRDAYMIVQVTPYENLVRDGQSYLREQDIRALLERKSELNRTEEATGERTVEQGVDVSASSMGVSHYDPSSHTYAMAMDVPVRGVGNMRGQIYGWFGDDVLVELTMYVPADRWEDYRPLYVETVESFEFDAGADYQQGLLDELPPLVRQAGLALLLFGAIIGAIKLWK
ncbi:MAG: hypothetical protein ACQEVA_23090, partial [Myxococcota bacterium]